MMKTAINCTYLGDRVIAGGYCEVACDLQNKV